MGVQQRNFHIDFVVNSKSATPPDPALIVGGSTGSKRIEESARYVEAEETTGYGIFCLVLKSDSPVMEVDVDNL